MRKKRQRKERQRGSGGWRGRVCVRGRIPSACVWLRARQTKKGRKRDIDRECTL